jgi:hypothetical protein
VPILSSWVYRENVWIKRDKYIKEIEKAKIIRKITKEEKNLFIFIFLFAVLTIALISMHKEIKRNMIPVIIVTIENLSIV